MDNYTRIKNAIKNRQQVIATYNGYYREMCPHVLGTKNGRRQALFYQFSGNSSTGRIFPGFINNWKCIPVDELKEIQVRDGKWYTASNYAMPVTCIDVIEEQVRFSQRKL